MCHYKHLTPFERERILFFLNRGESITKIAQLLNRSKSTISREIRRNAASADPSMPYYLPFEAQTLYVQRRKACRPHKRLDNASLRSYVQTCILKFHWSPEEIAGRIQLEYGHFMISVPTIYRAIHSGILNPDGTSSKYVLRKLRHHGKRHRKKGTKECRGKFVISHELTWWKHILKYLKRLSQEFRRRLIRKLKLDRTVMENQLGDILLGFPYRNSR